MDYAEPCLPCASVSIETLIPNAKPETRCLMRLVQSTGFHVMIDLQPLKSSDFPLVLQVVEELRAGDVLIQLTLSFMASRVLDTFLHAYRSMPLLFIPSRGTSLREVLARHKLDERYILCCVLSHYGLVWVVVNCMFRACCLLW